MTDGMEVMNMSDDVEEMDGVGDGNVCSSGVTLINEPSNFLISFRNWIIPSMVVPQQQHLDDVEDVEVFVLDVDVFTLLLFFNFVFSVRK